MPSAGPQVSAGGVKKIVFACDAHNGLWNAEAEKILFQHFGVQQG